MQDAKSGAVACGRCGCGLQAARTLLHSPLQRRRSRGAVAGQLDYFRHHAVGLGQLGLAVGAPVVGAAHGNAAGVDLLEHCLTDLSSRSGGDCGVGAGGAVGIDAGDCIRGGSRRKRLVRARQGMAARHAAAATLAAPTRPVTSGQRQQAPGSLDMKIVDTSAVTS